MPDATSSKTPATKRRSKIANAILARVFVYGGIGLVIVIYIVGFRGLLPRDRMRHRSVETTSMNTNHEGKPTKDAANSNSFPVTISPKATEETNWPNWRGLHYDGRSAETDLADTWPAEGPPVLWMREIGQGYSSVIAVENCVYTQSQTLTEQKVLALDAQTGETVWEHRYGWPYDPGGMYPGPRSTPTWADGKLYIAAPDGLILCLDATDGREIWSVNVNKKFGGRGTEFGYSASPLVENGKVILPVGAPFASVVALDAATGATVWKSGSAAASYCMALPITFAGRRQVVVFLQNELAGFDLQSGILLWGRSYSKGYDEHAAMPLYDEPYLRTMQPFRGGSDLFILHTLNDQAQPREGEASDDIDCRLKLVRTDKQMSNDVASSVLVDGCVYGFDLKEIQSRRQRPSRGEFRCMDFKTGEIHWSNKTIGQASIAVGDNKLFLFNDSGEAILLRVNAEKCEELARTEVFRGEICWTAPCLHHGRMYLRSPTKLACLYVGKPESLEIAARKQAQPTSAIPKENRLELNWIVGAERDAAFDLPDAKELTAWYWCCVVAIGISAFVAAIVYGILRFRGAGWQPAPRCRHTCLLSRPVALRHCSDAAEQPYMQSIRVHLASRVVCRPSDRIDEHFSCETSGRTNQKLAGRTGSNLPCACMPVLLRPDETAEPGSGLVLSPHLSCRLAPGAPHRSAHRSTDKHLGRYALVVRGILALLLDLRRFYAVEKCGW
jgi:outer membrane protein assembly factor BamB